MRQGWLRQGSRPGGAAVAGPGRHARRWTRASSSSRRSGAARGMAAGRAGAAPLRAPAGREGRRGWRQRPRGCSLPPFPGQRAGGDWAGRSRPPRRRRRPAEGSRPPRRRGPRPGAGSGGQRGRRHFVPRAKAELRPERSPLGWTAPSCSGTGDRRWAPSHPDLKRERCVHKLAGRHRSSVDASSWRGGVNANAIALGIERCPGSDTLKDKLLGQENSPFASYLLFHKRNLLIIKVLLRPRYEKHKN